jgi:putative methyltransferase (TIGR04325 family)
MLGAPRSHDIPFGHSGDFPSWEEAFSLCTDYQPEYEARVRATTLAVLKGQAECVRDGVAFDKVRYSWPLLGGLMYFATLSGGRLEVLDFGGSLGVTYLQNRRFLDRLPDVIWHIVEREENVEFGRRCIKHERIHFYSSIEECLVRAGPKVLLLSCVLQSLPDPYAFLCKAIDLPFKHILIDRLPLNVEPRDRLTIFRAPKEMAANQSRPWWFFDERKLLSIMTARFELVECFDSWERSNIPSRYVGYIFSRPAE